MFWRLMIIIAVALGLPLCVPTAALASQCGQVSYGAADLSGFGCGDIAALGAYTLLGLAIAADIAYAMWLLFHSRLTNNLPPLDGPKRKSRGTTSSREAGVEDEIESTEKKGSGSGTLVKFPETFEDAQRGLTRKPGVKGAPVQPAGPHPAAHDQPAAPADFTSSVMVVTVSGICAVKKWQSIKDFFGGGPR
ncbi:hypothetical protein [Amycolatopsis sp. CA-230715]|uniref:hypothetical protein n=1 Tax=Amycolatopsis sp. CA-230715 TaxID=2745196 RepID=UPI001C026A12|nr:hypothetical protein [Amycolatopsis sp. CA-230715]QWF82446.1 hypothetical protein HUW46_05883 [Amycolatopsis sp. CA-230715]